MTEFQGITSLYAEDKETFSSTLAMSLAAGVVSGISGNPVSVMMVMRTNMLLSLCFEPTVDRVSVSQFPFLQKAGTEPGLGYYVGASVINSGAMVLLVGGVLFVALIMKTAKQYPLERALHNLHFPGQTFPFVIFLGSPALFCGAVTITNASDPLNIVYGFIGIIFWSLVAIFLPMFVGKVFDAEYVVAQNLESEEQKKLLSLTGVVERGSDASSSSSRGMGDEDDDNAADAGDVVDEPVKKKKKNKDTESEGIFTGLFSKLRDGLEGIREKTAEAVSEKEQQAAMGGHEEEWWDEDEAHQNEADLKALAASTVDVLRDMFHHVKRTGGDEEKLLTALHGAGEWRDVKNEEDFLDDENEDEDAEEPVSFMRRYGVYFEQFNLKNKFHGFIELFGTFATCAVTGLWFFKEGKTNCSFQAFTYFSIQIILMLLMAKRKPFSARLNQGYFNVVTWFHVLGSACIAFGSATKIRTLFLMGLILGIIAVYMCAFRALLDLYLLIVARINSRRENWPSIQELTDLFLAAKERRDKGEMLTGPELTNDKASARSGKSAKSAMSRRSARFSTQYGKSGIQLFFKLATESDRFCSSRAIPEEYHPFIMRPLPDPVVLVTEERRAAIREKIEAAVAKAKWEATLAQMTKEQEAAVGMVSAAETFEENFDEEEARKKEEEARKKAEEEKTMPKMVRDLFQMGLQTRFDEADRAELSQAKIDDLLFPTANPRAEKLANLVNVHMAIRKMQRKRNARAGGGAAAGAGGGAAGAGGGAAGGDGNAATDDAEVQQAFAGWVRKDDTQEREDAEARVNSHRRVNDDEPRPMQRSRSGTMRAQFLKAAKEAKKAGGEGEEGGDDAQAGGGAAASQNLTPSAAPATADEDFDL